jgi:uncharacterized peroxidase-related enzyme
MFIKTVQEAEAEGDLREIYDGDLVAFGFVPDHARVFSLRPEVLKAWRAFQGSIRGNLPLRRYELVTLAAARALDSRYCQVAHGAVLIKNGMSVEEVRAILADFHDAGLEPVEVAVMDYAQKIALNAHAITSSDVDGLRGLGLDDVEILDVALAATMRCFASKTFDALGAGPDAEQGALEDRLADLLPERSESGHEATRAEERDAEHLA